MTPATDTPRMFLIVARTRDDAHAVELRLVHEPRRVRWITTDGKVPFHDGCWIDEVVWVDGWRAGRRAAQVEREVRRTIAKRPNEVVECETAA